MRSREEQALAAAKRSMDATLKCGALDDGMWMAWSQEMEAALGMVRGVLEPVLPDPRDEALKVAEEAMEKTCAELRWIPELARPCVGNTNVAVVERRLEEMAAALAKIKAVRG